MENRKYADRYKNGCYTLLYKLKEELVKRKTTYTRFRFLLKLFRNY